MVKPRKTAYVGLSAVLATTLCCPSAALALEPSAADVRQNSQMASAENTVSSQGAATTRTVATGTWGSCQWSIDDSGALVIGSGTGSSVDNSCPWSPYSGQIVSVSFSGRVTAPQDISGLFRDLTSLRSVDLSGLDASATTDVHNLFDGCVRLESVNMGGIDTRNATLFDGMFLNCSSLRTLDLSGLNTGRAMSFESLFEGCSSLESLNLSGWSASYVTHMENMFQGCSSLVSLDLSGLNSTNCSYFQTMFANCVSLETLDISNLGTQNAVNMQGMFEGCSALSRVRVGNKFSFNGSGSSPMTTLPAFNVQGHVDWFSSTAQQWMGADEVARTQNGVYAVYAKYQVPYEADPNPNTPVGPGETAASGVWGSCPWTLDSEGTLVISTGVGSRLNEQDRAPWHEYADSIKHVRFEGRVVAPIVVCGLFRDLVNAESIELEGLDLSGTEVVNWLFYNCRSLDSIDLSPLDFSRVINTNQMFSACRSLKTIDLTPFSRATRLQQIDEMFRDCSGLESIDLTPLGNSAPSKMGYMFYGCSGLRYVDLSPLDMSNNTSLAEMFGDCSSLITVGLKGLDTSKVTAMDGMFTGCSSLQFVDFSGIDTSKITTYEYLFTGCESLRAFDATSLSTGSATSLSYMFCGCTSLTSLDLSSFDTRNVTDFSNMFRGAENLRAINLSGWNTSNATNMAEMFFACPDVLYFDLRSFDTSKVRDMHGMFDWCTFTQRIDLSNFSTLACDNMANMFEGCVRLIQLDLGPNFSFRGSGSAWCDFPEGDLANYWSYREWYSTAAGAWILPEQIPTSYDRTASTYLRSLSAPSVPTPQESPFADVQNGAWYADAVNRIASKGLISGYGGTDRFGVGDSLSRGQVAQILWRYLEPGSAYLYDSAANETGLSDVEGFAWYTGAANWAVANRIINGYEDANGVVYAFGPNDPVTFEQLIRILYNTFGNGEAVDESVLGRFADGGSVSGWARQSMAWAVSKGIVNGGNGYLSPQENTARERAVVVLDNAIRMGIMD